MADILRITTPLVNRNQAVENKPNVGLATPFPLQDPSRVTKPGQQSGLLQQNNGMTQEETSALLLKLLKDPSVTVNFLQGISSMEAMIKLLPMHNNPFTQEMEQLFNQLLVPADQIAQELQRQEGGATLFKGRLFDLLREALRADPQQTQLREAAVTFLKALTAYLARQEALGSVGNGLGYLSQALSPSKELSQQLARLAARFQSADAPQQFQQLSREALALLGGLDESILFSEKTEKAVKMAIYNLSRYNGNEEFLRQATAGVLQQLRGDAARGQLLEALQAFLQGAAAGQGRKEGSSVMEALTRLLQRQAGSAEWMALSADKAEKILHSLLSSPCNFTPLLHFVLPVEYQDLHSFAEIWINPNGGEDQPPAGDQPGQALHLLLVFEIETIGRFEMELFVRDKTIDFSLYCPPAYTAAYRGMERQLRACAGQTGYEFGQVRVERLEHQRSLMDVFRSLPYKRTGVDVKI